MAIGKFVIKQIKKNPCIFKSVAAIGISYLGSRTTCHAKVSNARDVHTADLNMRDILLIRIKDILADLARMFFL